MAGYEIRTVDMSTIAALRSALLDPGNARIDVGPGDEHEAARHVGVFHDGVLVGVASIHPQAMPGALTAGAWRLSGVAVEHGHRGRGNGALLVERCLEHAAESDATAVWCVAPAAAFGFFERLGFGRHGDPMDGPVGGPRYLLQRRVQQLRRSWALQDA